MAPAQGDRANIGAIGAAGCVKTVVADAASYSSEQIRVISVSIETAEFQPEMNLNAPPSASQVHFVNRELQSPRSPPDLVVLLCHFVI
jgi:hypothetical protein